MARTSKTDVKDIYDTDLSDTQLQAFIDDANVFVDEHLSNKGLSSNILTAIEKYLSAHLASARDQRAESKDVADASVTFQGESGMHLESTQYGQRAIDFDSTGTLSQLGKGVSPSDFGAFGVDL